MIFGRCVPGGSQTICGKVVHLEASKTDEHGCAVHEECYLAKVVLTNDRSYDEDTTGDPKRIGTAAPKNEDHQIDPTNSILKPTQILSSLAILNISLAGSAQTTCPVVGRPQPTHVPTPPDVAWREMALLECSPLFCTQRKRIFFRTEVTCLPLDSAKNPGHGNNTRQRWESLVEQLRKTDDLQRIKELVIHLEEAVFNRQQKLVLNAAKLDKCDIQEEEQRLKQALDLMLEMKVKKLGFPEIRKSA